MSELQPPSSAADMAKQRREQRRRKLLMTSEERMQKIMGLSEENVDVKHESTQPTEPPSSSLSEPPRTADTPHIMLTEELQEVSQQQDTSHTHPRNRKVLHDSVFSTGTPDNSTSLDSLLSGSDPLRGGATAAVDTPKQDSVQLAFRRFRTMFVLLVGFLVRVAFMYDFGKLYIQTIINPFVALEISLLGFQKSAAMDFGSRANGGIISALTLLGVQQSIINTYKQVLGASTDVCQDFALYFLAFVITHVFI